MKTKQMMVSDWILLIFLLISGFMWGVHVLEEVIGGGYRFPLSVKTMECAFYLLFGLGMMYIFGLRYENLYMSEQYQRNFGRYLYQLRFAFYAFLFFLCLSILGDEIFNKIAMGVTNIGIFALLGYAGYKIIKDYKEEKDLLFLFLFDFLLCLNAVFCWGSPSLLVFILIFFPFACFYFLWNYEKGEGRKVSLFILLIHLNILFILMI